MDEYPQARDVSQRWAVSIHSPFPGAALCTGSAANAVEAAALPRCCPSSCSCPPVHPVPMHGGCWRWMAAWQFPVACDLGLGRDKLLSQITSARQRAGDWHPSLERWPGAGSVGQRVWIRCKGKPGQQGLVAAPLSPRKQASLPSIHAALTSQHGCGSGHWRAAVGPALSSKCQPNASPPVSARTRREAVTRLAGIGYHFRGNVERRVIISLS